MQNKPKIFESPDGGKTVYEREFGSNTRKEIKKEINIFIFVDISGMGDEIERIIKIYYFSNSYNKLF